jgi:3-dehydroquinate synthase
MKKITYSFSQSNVDCYVEAAFKDLEQVVDREKTILITDENVFVAHKPKFKKWNVITLKAGEEYKVQATVDAVIKQLIAFEADRKTMLVGVGGGVVTDLTGYIASVYMRGIKFGFVPTSLLAMVDASIGGKNGIDVGAYKNMVGVIRQPSFLFYDLSLLKTLPDEEWSNGFAEIIKHACILDAETFQLLEQHNIAKVKRNKELLAEIVLKNINLKVGVVQNDEFESGDRKLLNFGHTLGHALETQYELTHGQAVSLGMIFACWLSEKLLGFSEAGRVEQVLVNYGLPTRTHFQVMRVFKILKMDKKRVDAGMSYILLEALGKGIINQIPIDDLKQYLAGFNKINKG